MSRQRARYLELGIHTLRIVLLSSYISFSSQAFATSYIDNSSPIAPIIYAYAISYTFDQCGESYLGLQLRSAYRGLVNSCPFSPREQQEFLKKIQIIERDMQASSLEHDGGAAKDLPACARLAHNEELRILRQNLAAYSAGKVSAADALGLNCDGSHRSP